MSTVTSKIHFTLVGSQFPELFVNSLKAKPEEYVYTTLSSFAEYKAPDGFPTHVIVLHGHDEHIANAASLATLLGQPIVLAFFAPSKEVLDALHEASDCLISIPSIELEDGAPIVIHRRPHDGVITILPGFGSPIESTTVTPEEKAAVNFEQSAGTIGLTVKQLLESLHGDKVKAMVVDELSPPAGTNFCKRVVVPMKYTRVEDPTNSTDNQVEIHAYCANVKPTDPDFAKKGGIIYIIAVLTGYAACDNDSCLFLGLFYRLRNKSLHGLQGEPHAGTTSGSITTYDMGYAKNLNLWSNGKLFTFPAKYQDTFRLDNSVQKVEYNGDGNFAMMISPRVKSEVPLDGAQDKEVGTSSINLLLNGLFVWTTSSLTSHTIDFSLIYMHLKSPMLFPGGAATCILDLSKWN